jgi:serine phosphatase RsbU (regulator of sigma subunit)
MHSYLDSVINQATNICSNEKVVALALLNKAEEIAEVDNYPIELARIWRIKGLVYFYQVNYTEALDYFIQSRDLFKQLNNYVGEAKAIENIAIVYSHQDLFEQALVLKLEALDIRLKHGDSINLHRSYNNIAVSYADAKAYKEALKYYLKAVECVKILKQKHSFNLYYNNIGDVYLQLGEYDSAYIYFNKSLPYSIEENDRQIEADSYHYLGDYYATIGNINKAIEFYEKSYVIFEELRIIYEIEDIAASLHRVYAQTKNFEKAYEMHVLLKQMADSANSIETIQKLTGIEKHAAFEKEEKEQQFIHQLELHKQKLIRNYAMVLVLAFVVLVIVLIRSNIRKKKHNRELKEQRREIQQQNEEILTQHDKILHINHELEYQKKELETHRKNTLDGLIYAEHIQSSLLPDKSQFNEHFNEYFLFYRPKDIVSGDFYWLKSYDNASLIALSDCTGHGVPGAFMSVMGISFLNELVQKSDPANPAALLELLRQQVKQTLNPELKTNKSANYIDLYLSFKIKDGMDMALCFFDHHKLTLTFSGANTPILIVRDGTLINLKPNDNPIGAYLQETPFLNQTIQLIKGDMVYMFTDGYYDQYGGTKNKKFYVEPFINLLKDISGLTCSKQNSVLAKTLDMWQGVYEQIDDITVMGLRV